MWARLEPLSGSSKSSCWAPGGPETTETQHLRVGNIPCPRARGFSCLAVPCRVFLRLAVFSRVFSCLAVSSRVIPCHSFLGFCSTFRVIFDQVWKILDYHVDHSDTSIYYSFILSCIESIFGIEVLWNDRHQPHTTLLW